MARSPVTDLLEQFKTLNDVEQKVFLDLVDPEPEPEAPAKKTRKPRAARTPRAASISAVIAKVPKADPENSSAALPLEEGPNCVACGHPEDYMDHTGPSPTKHDFEAPKVKKAAAKI